MMRQSIIKAASPVLRVQQRSISTTVRLLAEGDTGAPRSGGVASGDAFSKREKANEDYIVKQREKTKLLELRKKIKEQQQHLQELEEHLDDLHKESGGEKN